MRKKKYENFIAKLMMTKDIIDAAELEKHIRNVVGYDKSSLEKEYFRINELIENQSMYLQPIITQYFIDNKSEIWLLFLIAHSKR